VAVMGAVNSPGRFQLQRAVRLLELLSFAGGPAERAGQNIQIIHAAAQVDCEAPASENVPEAAAGVVSYSLHDTLGGDDKANPYIRPGDIVSLPQADEVFVVGNVNKPTSILLKEPVTVSRAIAMAGGRMPDSKSDQIRIIRQVPGGQTKTEILVDLKAIERRKSEDVALQAGDIVDVPTSSGKRFLRGIVGALAPAMVREPVRIIR
jgi:polysaccharide biosynthesis/export protein